MKTKIFTPRFLAVICLLGIVFSVSSTAVAQEETPLTLSLRRDFGSSSGTGDIQGTFTLKARPAQAVEKVIFYIDGEPMGEVTSEPYDLRFVTDNYPVGVHSLTAKGFTATGQELDSNVIKVNFLSAEAARKTMFTILGFVLGAVILATLVSFAISTLVGRKAKALPLGAPRNYGVMGGAICPRCQRPFARTLIGANLVVGRLERCPHCGKWSLVHSASPQALRAAELAELEQAGGGPQVPSQSEEERLRKELEDSRFQDS